MATHAERITDRLEQEAVLEKLEYDLVRIPNVMAKIPLYDPADPEYDIFKVKERIESGDLQDYARRYRAEDSYPSIQTDFSIASQWIQENAPSLSFPVDIITTLDHFNEFLSGRNSMPFETVLQELASDCATSLLGHSPENEPIKQFREVLGEGDEPPRIVVLPGHGHVRSEDAFNLYYPTVRDFTNASGGLDIQKGCRLSRNGR